MYSEGVLEMLGIKREEFAGFLSWEQKYVLNVFNSQKREKSPNDELVLITLHL